MTDEMPEDDATEVKAQAKERAAKMGQLKAAAEVLLKPALDQAVRQATQAQDNRARALELALQHGIQSGAYPKPAEVVKTARAFLKFLSEG